MKLNNDPRIIRHRRHPGRAVADEVTADPEEGMLQRMRTMPALVVIVQFVLLLAGCGTMGTTTALPAKALQPAGNVILIIGDGMQLEHERAGNNYLFGNYAEGLAMWRFPYQGAVSTWDVTSFNRYATAAGRPAFDASRADLNDTATFDVLPGYDPAKGGKLPYPLDTTGDKAYLTTAATDSASAGTALSTGCKTDDGNVAWKSGDPENGRLPTIAELFRHQRKGATGVVTTVPFTHATPAVFVSHNKSRNNYKEIGHEIINSVKPEVVIGAGHPSYTSTYMDKRDYDILKASGEYVLAERQTGVDGNAAIAAKAAEAAAGGRKLFGLFGGTGGLFEYAVPSNTPGAPSVTRGSTENPSLAEASRAALRVLSRNENGFFLLIEQGDIDWSNHANNFMGMIGGIWDLNEAVKSVEAFIDQPDDGIDWSNTLVIVTSDHGNGYMRINTARPLQKGELPRQVANSASTGTYTPAFVYPGGEVTYASSGHTNELTRVYAKGKAAALFARYEGSWYPGTRIIDNTHIFRVMMQALGLTNMNAAGRAIRGHPLLPLIHHRYIRFNENLEGWRDAPPPVRFPLPIPAPL